MTKPKQSSTQLPSRWQQRFLDMLPTIKLQAEHRLRRLPGHEREELLAEAIAIAFCMFVNLVQRGKIDLAYATPLAVYGCRQALVGRRAGHPLNVNDITSRHCQQRKRVRVERLDRFDVKKGQWREAVVEDHRTPVPDQAAFRCDFPEWLKTLSDRDRQIAETLSTGEGTTGTAKQFGVTAGRISQVRAKLREAWDEFHGETVCAVAAG